MFKLALPEFHRDYWAYLYILWNSKPSAVKTILILFLITCTRLDAQEINIFASGTNASLRGLSVVSDKVIWVSGSNGTIGRSVDGGNAWKWMHVRDFEKADFRDIEAFDQLIAVVMGIGEPAYILRTIDGGENWKVVLSNNTKGCPVDS